MKSFQSVDFPFAKTLASSVTFWMCQRTVNRFAWEDCIIRQLSFYLCFWDDKCCCKSSVYCIFYFFINFIGFLFTAWWIKKSCSYCFKCSLFGNEEELHTFVWVRSFVNVINGEQTFPKLTPEMRNCKFSN